MAAAIRARATRHYGPHVAHHQHGAKVKAAAIIFPGTMVSKDATGFWLPTTAATALSPTAVALQGADATGKASGDLEIEVSTGIFGFDIGGGGDALTNADMGADVYAIDNQTVGKTNGGATRSVVGKLIRVEDGQAYVQFGIHTN